ncbi:disulfide bond formation protein DsbA, partial [Actinomadura adrarensis]
MQTADIWFDPSCPYTWITSRWLVEAARVRPIGIRWHVLSLSVLNEHLDEDPEGDTEGYLWMPVRVCAAVAERHGQE